MAAKTVLAIQQVAFGYCSDVIGERYPGVFQLTLSPDPLRLSAIWARGRFLNSPGLVCVPAGSAFNWLSGNIGQPSCCGTAQNILPVRHEPLVAIARRKKELVEGSERYGPVLFRRKAIL